MDTVSNNTLPGRTRVKRRRRSPDIRANVVAACCEPGLSIAAVARHYPLSANLILKWRKVIAPVSSLTPEPPSFLALPLSTTVTDSGSKVNSPSVSQPYSGH